MSAVQHTPISSQAHARVRRGCKRSLTVNAGVYLCVWVLYFLGPVPWWAVVPPAALLLVAEWTWLARLTWRDLKLPRPQQIVLPYPLSFQYLLAIQSIGVCYILVTAAGGRGGFLLVFLLVFPPAIAGLTMLAVGLTARDITAPCCPGCAYPVDPLIFPFVCPECARTLPDATAATTTPLVRRPVLAWCGGAVLTLALLALGSVFFRGGVLIMTLPRPALLFLAPENDDVFRALNTNALATTQRHDLADRILDARLHADPWDMEAQTNWLAAELLAGALTPEQADRFASGGLTLTILAEGAHAVAQPLEVSLAGDSLKLPDTGVAFRYFFGGFETDGAPPVLRTGRAWKTGWLRLRPESDARSLDRPPERMVVPVARIVPTAPGPLTVRATIIAVTVPMNSAAPTITRHDDGSYTITPEPLTRHEFDAEVTLTIAP